MASFNVSEFCHIISCFEFREIFGEQKNFVLLKFLYDWSKFCFLKYILYHYFGRSFCNKPEISFLRRRRVFLGINYRYQSQKLLHCSHDKSWIRKTYCLKTILQHFLHCYQQVFRGSHAEMLNYKKGTIQGFAKFAGKYCYWKVFLSNLQWGDTKFCNNQVKTFKCLYLNIVAANGMKLFTKFTGATPIKN